MCRFGASETGLKQPEPLAPHGDGQNNDKFIVRGNIQFNMQIDHSISARSTYFSSNHEW